MRRLTWLLTWLAGFIGCTIGFSRSTWWLIGMVVFAGLIMIQVFSSTIAQDWNPHRD